MSYMYTHPIITYIRIYTQTDCVPVANDNAHESSAASDRAVQRLRGQSYLSGRGRCYHNYAITGQEVS